MESVVRDTHEGSSKMEELVEYAVRIVLTILRLQTRWSIISITMKVTLGSSA